MQWLMHAAVGGEALHNGLRLKLYDIKYCTQKKLLRNRKVLPGGLLIVKVLIV